MIERRSVLGGIAGVAATPALARAGTPIALGTSAARLRNFMLMRGALDDRLVIGCLSGVYQGCVEGVTTPLFGVVSATFARYRAQTDGSYAGVSLEQAYFVDLATGEWLHRFANPYTGRTVDVPTGSYPAVRIVFTPALEMRLPDAPPGQALHHSVSDFRIEGGHVWLTETTQGVTPGRGAIPLQYHEIVGLHARAGELARQGAKQVPCTCATGREASAMRDELYRDQELASLDGYGWSSRRNRVLRPGLLWRDTDRFARAMAGSSATSSARIAGQSGSIA